MTRTATARGYGIMAALTVILAATGVAAPALAAGGPASASPIQRWNAAATMADWGRESGDPVILLAAARVLMGAGVPFEPNSGDPWNPARVLDDARELAAGRPAVLAMIEEAVQSRERGVFKPVTRVAGRIEPGISMQVDLVFPAGTLSDAAARISGPAGAGIGIVVRDSSDRVVAGGSGAPARMAYAQWTSDGCKPYTVELTNTGSQPVDVVLAAVPSTEERCSR